MDAMCVMCGMRVQENPAIVLYRRVLTSTKSPLLAAHWDFFPPPRHFLSRDKCVGPELKITANFHKGFNWIHSHYSGKWNWLDEFRMPCVSLNKLYLFNFFFIAWLNFFTRQCSGLLLWRVAFSLTALFISIVGKTLNYIGHIGALGFKNSWWKPYIFKIHFFLRYTRTINSLSL